MDATHASAKNFAGLLRNSDMQNATRGRKKHAQAPSTHSAARKAAANLQPRDIDTIPGCH